MKGKYAFIFIVESSHAQRLAVLKEFKWLKKAIRTLTRIKLYIQVIKSTKCSKSEKEELWVVLIFHLNESKAISQCCNNQT